MTALPFELPDHTIDFSAITPQVAEEALLRELSLAQKAFDALEASPPNTYEGLVRGLHDLAHPILHVWGLISHMHSVMNAPEWRDLIAKHQYEVVAFSIRMGQSEQVYNALKQIEPSTPVEARVLAKMIVSAKLSGVGLPEAERQKFNALSAQSAELGMTFSNNLLDATNAYKLNLSPEQVAELPASLQELLKRDDGSYVVTLEASIYVPFMQLSPNRALREQLHRAYVTRAAEANAPLIAQLLDLRNQLAQLLGYKDYVSVSLETKMASSESEVRQLLNQLSEVGLPIAKSEHEELLAFAQNHGWQADKLEPWDVAYWTEQLRQEKHALDEEALRVWFPFEQVLQGFFKLCESLFGIRIHDQTTSVSRWHNDVRFYSVTSVSNDQPIASFYLDPYSRPETKSGGAWMNDFRTRDGKRSDLPVAVLVCNFPRPSAGKSSCLRFDDVTTLFHEFGHALQHMLTHVDDPQVAGINGIEWDAVEIASQFMENFCYSPAVIRALSHHVESGETIPSDLVDRIIAARDFRAATSQQRQLYFALTDLTLHGAEVPQDANAVKEMIGAQVLPVPPPDYDRFLCTFSHIFGGGYAAGYYSYKWSEVLAADLFEPFEAILDNPAELAKLGTRYAQTLFGEGGSRTPAEVFHEIMGRAPSPNALLKHLRHETVGASAK